MAMIKIENLTFSYPGSFDNIFENVSFHIDTDWRLGFAGRNGRGKTTFLSLLLGKYEYRGKIISPVSFGYFPYDVKDESRLTGEILSEICPGAEEWEFMREISLLDAEADILWRPFEILSKGEQTKALLAALFLGENRFLLIDEPTNHLDIRAREKVAEYLKKKKGFILVSHDRRFLDACTDHTLSINKTNIEVQSGNFSVWFEGFNQRQEYEQSRSDHLKKEVKQLRQAAKKTAEWSAKAEKGKYGQGPVDRGFIGHKAAKMMKRSKNAEARQLKAADEKAGLLKNAETNENLKIFPLEFYADTLVSFSHVEIFYGEKKVCEPVSFTVRRGERISPLTAETAAEKAAF